MGGNAKAITGHSDDAVIEQFYLNKEAVAKAALGFEVFSSEISRKNELDQLRSKINEHQIKLEI
jgi:hypothetical protein